MTDDLNEVRAEVAELIADESVWLIDAIRLLRGREGQDVRKLGLFRYQGQCRCRWQGPIRLTHAKAASDCLQHEL
jgi:hypothetical protein